MSRRKQSHPKPVLKRDDSLTGEDMASEIEDTMEIDESTSCTTPATQHGSSDKESALSTSSTEQPSLAAVQSASSVSEAESTMAASTAKKRKMDQSTESAEEGESPLPPPSPAGLNVKIEPSDRDPPLSESPQPSRSKHVTPTPDAEPMVNGPQVAAAAASLGFPLSMNSAGLPFNADLFTSLRYLHMLRNGLASGIPTGLPDAPELPLKSAISPSLPVPPAHLCVPCGIRFSSLSTLEAHQTYYCSHRLRQAAGSGSATAGNGTLEADSHSTQDQESQPESKTPGSESASEENRNLSSMLFEAMVGPPPIARVRRSGKYYTCPYCSFSADKRVSLNRHLRSHVGLPMLATTAVSPPPPPPPPPMPPAPAAPPRVNSAQQHEDNEEPGVSVASSRADRYCVECDIQFNSIKTFRVHKQLYCRGKVGTLRSHLLHPSQSSLPSTSNPSLSPSTSSLSSALMTAAHSRLIDSNDADPDRQASTPSGTHSSGNPNKESSASWPMLILPTQPPILVPFHIVQSANFWPDHLVAPPQSLLVMPDGVVQGISSPVNHPSNTPATKPQPAQNHSTSSDEGAKDQPGLVKSQPLRSPPASESRTTIATLSPTRSPECRTEDTTVQPPPASLVTNLDGALDLSVKPPCGASEGNSNRMYNSYSAQKSPTPEIDVAIAAKCEVIIKMETASPQPPSVANSPVTKSPTMMEFNSSNDPIAPKGWREAKEPPQGNPTSTPLVKQNKTSPGSAGNNGPGSVVTPPNKLDVSKCEDCNITFHRHDNYLIHKQHYCANRNGSVDQRAQTDSPTAPRQEMSISPDDSDNHDSNKAALKTAATVNSSKPCFQFICVTCGIKFGSLNNLKAHQTYYCSRTKDPESQNVPATSPVCPTTVRASSTSSSTTTDPAAAEAPANLALSPIPAASPVQRRGSETDSVDTLTSSGSVALQGGSGNSVWKCPCCGAVCNSLLSAQKHIESHPNIRAFRCTLCGYRGNTLRGMRTHVRTLHFDRKSADMQEENYIACIFQNETNGPNDSASPTRDFSARATPTMGTSSGSSTHPFGSENMHPFNLMADFQRLLVANGADHPDLATLAGTMPPELALQMEALMRLQQQHQASSGEKMLIPPAFLNALGKPPSTGVGCRSDKLFLCDLCCYSSSYRGNVLRHAKLVHSRDLIDVPVVSPAFLQAQKLLNLRNLDLLAQSDKVLTSPEPLHVKVDPEGLLSWPNHSVDKPAHSGNSTSSNGSTHAGHNSNPSSNGSIVSNNNNNTTKMELLSPAAAANLNTSPVPPRLVTAPGAVISPKLANGFPDVQDVAQKTCKSCNITFTYMSTFLAHKKYYCGSQSGSEGAELPKSPSETPVQ